MADIQIVDVYQYKSSIPIETLLSGYSDEEVYAECIERVVPISFPYGTSLAGVKEIIENFINIPKSLQRISFNIGEEIDDEKLLLPQQITTLHVECFRAAPRSNTNNNNNNYSDEDYGVEKSIIEISNSQYLKHGKNRDETGKIIPLKIAYLDTKRIEIDARTTYKISDIKDDIKIKNPELAAYTNSELRFLSDPPMEDNKYLNEYLEDIFNEGNNTYCFRLVVRPEDGAFSPSVAKGLVGLISEESAQKDLLRLIDEAKGQDIHVFPVKNIPANYWWVLKIKDYSEKAERNKELVTEKQKKVIYDYTGDSWYAKINFLLATLTTPPKIEREFIETLILALCDSYQTNLPDQVVRMTSFSDEELAFYKDNEGETVCMPSFMSTSSKEMAAFGTVRIVVQLTKGKRRGAMLIEDYSKYKTEAEILLSAFSFYKIISVDLTSNPREIRMAYLDAIHHYRAEKKN